MKIWLITNLYTPDVHGGAVLYANMAEWLAARGHDVRVTTTFSYYPEWKLRPADVGRGLYIERVNGLLVRRIGMYVPARPSGAKRLLSDVSFLASLIWRGRHPGWQPDVTITAEPMLSQCTALRFLHPFGPKVRKVIIVQDFVADAAIELGLLKHPLLKAGARWLERWSLSAADLVTTISPGMLAKLHTVLLRSDPSSTSAKPTTAYLPNWIHSSLATAALSRARATPARRSRMLLYSGNLGFKQGLPAFVSSFCRLKHDWTLLIHGSGAAAADLRTMLKEEQDPRVVLGPVLAESDYLDLLFSVTACVITQKSGVGANFLPSKLLPCLATATPVLAVADAASPLAQEVDAGSLGVVATPDSDAALAQALAELENTPPQHYTYALHKRAELYSVDRTLGTLESWISAHSAVPSTKTTEDNKLNEEEVR